MPSPNLADEVAERQKVVAQMLAIFCAASGREPFEGAEKRMKVGVYSTALEEIPTGELLALAKRQTQKPASRFIPTPYELKRLWHGDEGTTDENGQTTFIARGNAAAYDSWDPQTARSKHSALPETIEPLAIEPEVLKERLGIVVRNEFQQQLDAERAAEMTAHEREVAVYGEALWEMANVLNVDLVQCTIEQRITLRDFALWRLQYYPHSALGNMNFNEEYAYFDLQYPDWKKARDEKRKELQR